uniref:Uncharacterized protein n=1 Tax=Anguilla anguilla TaxID=7936 RepID=A0A0E9TGM1_ANGAN
MFLHFTALSHVYDYIGFMITYMYCFILLHCLQRLNDC